MSLGAVVVDVRSAAEYDRGHVPGSLHVPMHLIPIVAAERLPADRPVLVCCESGSRSAMAVQYLRRLGLDAHDLGPWTHFPGLS